MWKRRHSAGDNCPAQGVIVMFVRKKPVQSAVVLHRTWALPERSTIRYCSGQKEVTLAHYLSPGRTKLCPLPLQTDFFSISHAYDHTLWPMQRGTMHQMERKLSWSLEHVKRFQTKFWWDFLKIITSCKTSRLFIHAPFTWRRLWTTIYRLVMYCLIILAYMKVYMLYLFTWQKRTVFKMLHFGQCLQNDAFMFTAFIIYVSTVRGNR